MINSSDMEKENSLPEPDRQKGIKDYVNFIQKCGFKILKVVAPKDEFLYSMKVLVEFEIDGRKRFGFFSPAKMSEFSLVSFMKAMAGTNTDKADFEKMIKARMVPFTKEEVICALLSDDAKQLIEDIYIDGELKIPSSSFGRLFELFNFKGGNLKNRVVRR